MSDSAQPDLGALYLRHRDAMYRVAYATLRDAGLSSQAEDAVSVAVESILASPPQTVRNWEAFLVSTAKRKAIDILRSAVARHSAGALAAQKDAPADDHALEELDEAMDRAWAAARVWDALAILDDRHRKAVWDRVALERDRGLVAVELGVTPARVSQLVAEALLTLKEHMMKEIQEEESA